MRQAQLHFLRTCPRPPETLCSRRSADSSGFLPQAAANSCLEGRPTGKPGAARKIGPAASGVKGQLLAAAGIGRRGQRADSYIPDSTLMNQACWARGVAPGGSSHQQPVDGGDGWTGRRPHQRGRSHRTGRAAISKRKVSVATCVSRGDLKEKQFHIKLSDTMQV